MNVYKGISVTPLANWGPYALKSASPQSNPGAAGHSLRSCLLGLGPLYQLQSRWDRAFRHIANHLVNIMFTRCYKGDHQPPCKIVYKETNAALLVNEPFQIYKGGCMNTIVNHDLQGEYLSALVSVVYKGVRTNLLVNIYRCFLL